MELPESIMKQRELDQVEASKKFLEPAEKYASQGFDEDSVSDLLCLDGCPRGLSEKISHTVANGLPDTYAKDSPPTSFEDVREAVKKAIMTASVDDLNEYFNKYASNIFSGVVNRILLARDCGGNAIVQEVIQELEPLVDDIIVTNAALESNVKVANKVDDKERLEQKLFGIWPAHLVRERNNIDAGDIKLISRSKVVPGNISLI